jgi:hypothetical protein
MRWFALAGVITVVVAPLATASASNQRLAATDASDEQLAAALVVPHADVPSYWTSKISRNPCPFTAYPSGVRLTAHVTTRWASPQHGLWSTAAVTVSVAQARSLFDRVSEVIPVCVEHSLLLAPKGQERQASIAPIEYGRLGSATRGWTVESSIRRRGGLTETQGVDVVIVHLRRAVAWYQLGTFGKTMNETILRRALVRAAALH